MKLDNKTMDELIELQESLCNNQENRETDPGSVYIYNQKTRKKLDEIARQITYLISLRKKERGIKIDESGYSGRKTNKRR